MPGSTHGEKKTLLMVQVLRAVAVMMVVGYHVSDLLMTRLGVERFYFFNGAAGVDVFFVISGVVMVISSQSIAKSQRPGHIFFARRLERIVPLYWIATTLKLVVLYAAPRVAAEVPPSLWHDVRSYLFLPALHGVRTLPVLTVGWTLNYEMLFYLFFGLALALRVSPLRVLLPTLGLIGVIACFMKPGGTGLVIYDDRIVFEFLFGVVLGQAVIAGKVPGRIWSLVLMLAGLGLLFTVQPTFTVTRVVAWGLPALAVVAGAIGLESSVGQFVPGWLLEIGNASYAIYLFHGFVLSLLGILIGRVGVGRGFSIVIAIVFGVVLSALVGIGIYRTIERPLSSYFRQRHGRAVPANV